MTRYRNTILQSLDAVTLSRLRLQPIQFRPGQEIEQIGQPASRILFVETGMASMTTSFEDGFEVEVTMFGFESIIGISALMGSKMSFNRVYTQIEGEGFFCSLQDTRQEFQAHGIFRQRALQYVQAQLLQSMQSAACNVRHSIEKRLARWLLLYADRTNSHQFNITQEYLSHMLGCNRATASSESARLMKRGLIEYKRGKVRLLDIAGLQAQSCECYQVIKLYLDSFISFGTDTVS